MRRFATQIEVLEAIVHRLRESISIYNDANCVVYHEPIPEEVPIGKEFCTVSPEDAQFVGSMFTGGGVATLCEDLTVNITPLVRHVRDRTRRSEQRIASPVDGLATRKHQILSALFGGDYDLKSEDGARFLLRDQLTPMSAQAIGSVQVGEYRMSGFSMRIHCPFDWYIEGRDVVTPGPEGDECEGDT